MNDEILLIDKPAGVSSFGVVARVRRELSEKAGMVEVRGKDGVLRQKRRKVKVGHTGTLDPFATGLLILLTGKNTRRAGEFLKLDKEYVATIELGKVSSTGDPEGVISPAGLRASSSFEVRGTLSSLRASPREKSEQARLSSRLLRKSDPRPPEESSSRTSKENEAPPADEVASVVQSFVGEIEQTVPAFSAVKINGQRAYKLAREGKKVEMPRRKVTIYEIEILEYKWPYLTIRCKVSSGTYIRALGEDIGKKLGVGGYLTALRRTEVGKYRVEDARKMEIPAQKPQKAQE